MGCVFSVFRYVDHAKPLYFKIGCERAVALVGHDRSIGLMVLVQKKYLFCILPQALQHV